MKSLTEFRDRRVGGPLRFAFSGRHATRETTSGPLQDHRAILRVVVAGRHHRLAVPQRLDQQLAVDRQVQCLADALVGHAGAARVVDDEVGIGQHDRACPDRGIARQGVELAFPAAHPFNPLGLLRLAIATQAQGLPNRYVCETLFKHVWTGGADAADAARLQAVTALLAPDRDPGDDSVKAQLKAHGDTAIAQGVFGVPSFEVDCKVFWGLDALPMLRAYLEGDAWFADNEADKRWNAVQAIPSGIPSRTA